MNTDTGQVYMSAPAILAAQRRGEPLVGISKQAARRILEGYRAKRAMQKASRKKNRRRK